MSENNISVTTITGDGSFIHRGDSEFYGEFQIHKSLSDRSKPTSLLFLSLTRPPNEAENPVEGNEEITMITSQATSPSDYHLQLHSLFPKTNPDDVTTYHSLNVLNITGQGDLETIGSLSVGNGRVQVVNGLISAEGLNLGNSLDVNGSAAIEQSLTIGSGLTLTPEGIMFDISKHDGPLLGLRSSQQQFDGAYLQIDSLTTGEPFSNTSMIRTTVDGLTTFDLKTNGQLVVNGLQTKSGGLIVSSGGIQVRAGGLSVHGGLTLHSGVLDLKQNDLIISSIVLDNNQSYGNILTINQKKSYFVGPVVEINDLTTSDQKYSVFETKMNNLRTFVLDSQGNLDTVGSVNIQRDVNVNNHLNVAGTISLSSHQIIAADVIELPVDKIFIEIIEDHKVSHNLIVLPSDTLQHGQLLILRNLDETPLTLQSAKLHTDHIVNRKIPFGVTLLLIFNGNEWIDIQSISTSIEKLKNIQEIELQNDVVLGNHTITSGGYRMFGLQKGEVLVGGIGGAIKGRKGLTYSNGVLATQGLHVQSLESDLNGNMKTISNIVLNNPTLTSASISAHSITIPKTFGVAYFTRKGELKASSSVQLTEDGHLEITDLYNSINFQNNSLHNISTLSCHQIDQVETASIRSLYLSSHVPGTKGDRLMSLRSDGLVQSTPLVFDPENRQLFVEKIYSNEQMSDVLYHQNKIINATISHGKIENVEKITTNSIQILSSTSSIPKSLAVIASDGSVQADRSDNAVPITASVLSVNDIFVQSFKVPFAEKIHLVGTADMKLVSTKSLTYNGEALQTPSLRTQKIISNEIFLEDLKSSSILSTDSTGKLVSTSQIKLDDIQTAKLTVSGPSKLIGDVHLAGLSSTVLSVDKDGRIVSGNAAHFEKVEAKMATFSSLILDNLDSNIGVLVNSAGGIISATESPRVKSITASSIISEQIKTSTLFTNEINSPLLVTNSDGKIITSADFKGHSVDVQNALTKFLTAEKIRLTSLSPTSFLGVDVSGDVIPTRDGNLESLIVKKLQVQQHLSVNSLQLQKPVDEKNVIVCDSQGNLVPTNSAEISMKSLHAKGDSSIDGLLTVKSLKMTDLFSKSIPEENQIIHLGEDGKLKVIPDIKVRSMEARESVTAPFGKFRDLELLEVPKNQPLVLNEKGRVASTQSISVQTLHSQEIKSAVGHFKALVLEPIQTANLLQIGSNGSVSPTQHIQISTAIIDNKLTVSGEAHVQSLFFIQPNSNSPNQLLEINSNGQIVPQSHLHPDSITTDQITTKNLLSNSLKLGLKVDKPSLLMIDSNGIVSSVTENDKINPKLTLKNVDIFEAEIKELKLDLKASSGDHSNGLLTTDEKGRLVLVSRASLEHIQTNSFQAKDLHIQNKLTLNRDSLANPAQNTRTTVLSINNETGEVSLRPNVEVYSLQTENLSSNNLIASSFQSTSQSNTLLAVDKSGYFISSEHIDGRLQKLTAQHIQAATLQSTTLTLPDVYSSQLPTASDAKILGISSSGVVSAVKNLTISSINSHEVEITGNLATHALVLSNLSPGVLYLSQKNSKIESTNHLVIDEISAKSVAITSTIKAPEIIISELKSLASSSFLLSTDSTGKLVSTSQIKLDDIQTAKLTVSGPSKLIGDVHLAGLSSTVLSVDKDGRIVSGNDAKLGDITTKSIQNLGKLVTSDLEITTLTKDGILYSDSKGHITTKTDLVIESMKTNSLQVNSDGKFSDLFAKSFHFLPSAQSRTSDEILFVEPNGRIVSRPTLGRLSVTEGHFHDLSVSEKISSKSLQLILPQPLASDNTVLTTNRNGVVQLSSDLTVNSVKLHKLQVDGEIETPAIKITSIKPLKLVSSDANGYLSSFEKISINRDGVLSISDLIVENVQNEINFNKNRLLNTVISKGQIINSDIVINDESKFFDEGSLAVFDQSGSLGLSSKISVGKSGSLKVGSIQPNVIDGSVKIQNAELHSPHLLQARIDSKDIKTATLLVTGATDLNGDVFIDGSVNVRGSVIGSGPYIDSSDSRFKTNVTSIQNALDIVTQMKGVTYDNRWEEFPHQNFDHSRQMGWIADDIMKLVPELVMNDSDGYKHVAYSRSVALLGEAIKELRTECSEQSRKYEEIIEAQQKSVDILSKELSDLRNQMSEMIQFQQQYLKNGKFVSN